MKAKDLTQDELAKFLFDKALNNINSYNYDMIYDIGKIAQLHRENRGKSDIKVYSDMSLMIRSTGCDLIYLDDDCYDTYALRADSIYNLTFCWNYDYFYDNIPFCSLTKIK